MVSLSSSYLHKAKKGAGRGVGKDTSRPVASFYIRSAIHDSRLPCTIYGQGRGWGALKDYNSSSGRPVRSRTLHGTS